MSIAVSLLIVAACTLLLWMLDNERRVERQEARDHERSTVKVKQPR